MFSFFVVFRPKYTIRENKSAFKVVMWLVIRHFGSSDIGTYNCVSTNSLGKAEGTLRLYGKYMARGGQILRKTNFFNYLVKLAMLTATSDYKYCAF